MGAGSPDLNDVTNLLRSVRCAPPARAVQVLIVIPTRRFFWRPMGSSEPSGLVLGATGFVLPQPCEVMGVATLCATSQSRDGGKWDLGLYASSSKHPVDARVVR